MNRRPLLLIGPIFLLACAPCLAEKRGARLFQPALPFSENQREDTLSLYKGRHDVLQRYAWAMTALRRSAAVPAGENPYGHGFAKPAGDTGVSTFVGPEDMHVIRLRNGSVVIGRGEPSANLYAETDCEYAGPQALLCRDGSRRSILARSGSSLLIEGAVFELAE